MCKATKQEFHFKRFSIQQDKCAMKVGTDGVLLGAWIPTEAKTKYILDIGTGTGLIALMAAQKNPNAIIDAVEIEPNAAQQARENIQNSIWSKRIQVYNCDLKDFQKPFNKQYDYIISNPPFFNTQYLPNKPRFIARHTQKLSFETLIDYVEKNLIVDGKFFVIIPPLESIKLIECAIIKGLHCTHQLSISSQPTKKIVRVLLTFEKNYRTKHKQRLSIYDGNEYSTAYKKLTNDFYLNIL